MKLDTFSQRLTYAMDQAGFTQASLGNAVGMSQPSVWKLTSEKHAIRANFLKYQKCLSSYGMAFRWNWANA